MFLKRMARSYAAALLELSLLLHKAPFARMSSDIDSLFVVGAVMKDELLMY
jgi:hypothetical protein